MTLGTLNYQLVLNSSGFDSGVKTASQKFRGLKDDVDNVDKSANDAADTFKIAFGNALGNAIGDMAGQMTDFAMDFAADGLNLASAVEQTNSKLQTLVGKENAAKIREWAETTKSQYGISSQAAKQYVSDIAGLWGNEHIGFTSDELTAMGMKLVELTGDLASFNNFTVPETWRKILSGMRGETEAIEDLGIDLRAKAISSFFDMKESAWGKLGQQERILKTYQYVLAMTSHAQGDFARTGDSYQNQLALFNANIEELKTSLGTSILPVMTQLVTWFNALFGGTKSAQEGMEDVRDTYGKSFASIEATVTQANALIEALDGVSTATEDAAAYEKWDAIMAQLQTALPGISELIDENTGYLIGGTDALRAYVAEYEATSKQLAQMEAMKSTTDAYNKLAAELAGMEMNDYLNEIRRTAAQGEMDSALGEVFSYIQKGMESSGVGGKFSDVKTNGSDQLVAMLRAIYSGKDAWTTMYDYIEGSPDLDTFWDYFAAGGGTEDIVKALANQFIANEEYADKYGKDYDEDIKQAKADLQALSEEITLWKQILQDYDKKPDGTGSGEDVADAAAAGAKKGAAEAPGDNITIQNHFYVDSNEVANVMVPKVINKLNWKLQAQTKG